LNKNIQNFDGINWEGKRESACSEVPREDGEGAVTANERSTGAGALDLGA
jgi:hypothetical protein